MCMYIYICFVNLYSFFNRHSPLPSYSLELWSVELELEWHQEVHGNGSEFELALGAMVPGDRGSSTFLPEIQLELRLVFVHRS